MSSFRRLSVGAALLVVSALSPAVALVCDEGGVFDATSTLRRDGTAELEVRFPPHMLGFQTRLKDLLGDVPFEVSKERGGLVWVVSMSFDSVDAIAALMMEEYEIGMVRARFERAKVESSSSFQKRVVLECHRGFRFGIRKIHEWSGLRRSR